LTTGASLRAAVGRGATKVTRMARARRCLVVMIVAACACGSLAAQSRPTRVLFLCPHGAAKSVLASTYFVQQAAARGLRVKVDFAGTEPDAAIAPNVDTHLRNQGLHPLRLRLAW
jgi:hypothetical protein